MINMTEEITEEITEEVEEAPAEVFETVVPHLKQA